jgi:hypothetical protein
MECLGVVSQALQIFGMINPDRQYRFDHYAQRRDSAWHELAFSAGHQFVFRHDRTHALLLEYVREVDGISLASNISAHAAAPHTTLGAVTYQLHICALATDSVSTINEILSHTPSNGDSAFEILKKLYEVTGPDFWTTSPMDSSVRALSPEAFTLHDRIPSSPQDSLTPDLPSLSEYLHDPECLGRQYSAERMIGGELFRLEARIRPVHNDVLFTILSTDGEDSTEWQPLKLFEVKGTTPSSAADNRIEHGLKQITREEFTHFESAGYAQLVGKQPYKPEPTDPSLTSDHVILSSGASVNLAVSPDKVILALSSDALDPKTLQNPSATVCRWEFLTPTPEAKQSTYRMISGIVVRLSQEHSPSASDSALRSLLSMNASSRAIDTPPLEKVIPPALARYIQSIPGMTVTVTPPDVFDPEQLPEQLAEILQGIRRLTFSMDNFHPLTTDRHIFNSMDALLHPDGSLRLDLRNRMQHGIKASFSSRTVEPTATRIDTEPGLHILATLSAAFAKQLASGAASSEARAELLATLQNFQRVDPQRNSVKQSGQANLPSASDLEGQRLLDRAAAPLIRFYTKVTKEIFTVSRATSTGSGEMEVLLGERYHPYQLGVALIDDTVSGITITPRVPTPEGPALKHHKAKHYSCSLPLGDPHDRESTLKTLRRVVREFCTMVDTENDNRAYGSSRLRKLLEAKSGPFAPL